MNQKLAAIALAAAALVVVLVFLVLPGPSTPVARTDKPTPEKSSKPQSYASDFGSGTATSGPLAGSSIGASSLPPGMAWEDRLDELLSKDAETADTVRELVASARGLPPEAQEEFMAHAVNLCEDEQYNVVSAVYLDPSTPRDVSDTIFNDLLNRPDEIKLPVLARTLQIPSHPMKAEAKEILEMYLNLDPGSEPPGGWEQAVKTYIREQGAE